MKLTRYPKVNCIPFEMIMMMMPSTKSSQQQQSVISSLHLKCQVVCLLSSIWGCTVCRLFDPPPSSITGYCCSSLLLFLCLVNQNRNCIWALTFLIEREYLFTLTAICAFQGQNKHQARRTIPCFSCNKMKDKKKTKTLKRTWRGHFRLQHLCKQKSRRGNLQQNQDLLKTDHHILNWKRQNYSSGLRLD